MKTKQIGILALITLVLTAAWLILLIWDMATAGSLETFDQILNHISALSWQHTLTYANAGLLTIVAVMFMTSLYTYCQPTTPGWALIGLIFIPIYGTLNLIAYLSQITLVPALVHALNQESTYGFAYLLLSQSIQLSPDSAIGFFNALAYAILGIPSIVFGLTLMGKNGHFLSITGWLLMLNGVACIAGPIGILIGNSLLSVGTMIGGVLFFLALIFATIAFLGDAPEIQV